MKLFGMKGTRSLRAAWALEEAGLTYSYVTVDIMQGEGQSTEFKKINPGGKVPALVVGEEVITESAAIINYIGAIASESQLVPVGDPVTRAHYDQWCYFALTELEQPLWNQFKHQIVLPEHLRCPSMMEATLWEFAKAVQTFSIGLGNRPYILGDQFSGADILLGNTLSWTDKMGFALEIPNVHAYKERLMSRPALAKARDVENAS